MPVLRSKKKMYNPEDYEVFCGEEMKPFVALPVEEEGAEVKNQDSGLLVSEATEINPEPAKPAMPEPQKTRLWNKLGKIFRPA